MGFDFLANLCLERAQRNWRDTLLKAYDHISRRQFMPSLPESFADDTLDGVPGDGKRREPLGDDQPETGSFSVFLQRPAGCRDDKIFAPRQMLSFESGCILGGTMQAGRWGKTGAH